MGPWLKTNCYRAISETPYDVITVGPYIFTWKAHWFVAEDPGPTIPAQAQPGAVTAAKTVVAARRPKTA